MPTRIEGCVRVVYLVSNTIMNVTTQHEQAAVFANAAAHREFGLLRSCWRKELARMGAVGV